MVLIAGAGFGGSVFEAFMRAREDEFTMHAVTLPGFAGTPAPPMPAEGTSYGAQTWTTGAVDGVRRLITDRELEKPVIVAHWFGATQVALRLAAESPEIVGPVVIVSGIAEYSLSRIPAGTPLEQRARFTDGLAKSWFKTVTRDTWDDNNFLPGDYAIHPVRALQLWRQAAAAPLPVWVRYLCEAWASDVSLLYGKIESFTLVLIPGFDEEFHFEEAAPYMRGFCQDSWDGASESNPLITTRIIEGTRVFMMDDQPEKLDKAVDAFLAAHE